MVFVHSPQVLLTRNARFNAKLARAFVYIQHRCTPVAAIGRTFKCIGQAKRRFIGSLLSAVVEHIEMRRGEFYKPLAVQVEVFFLDVLAVKLGEVNQSSQWHVRVERRLLLKKICFAPNQKRYVVFPSDINDILDGRQLQRANVCMSGAVQSVVQG